MKVKGVDHPLQHVLGALSALCKERKKNREVKKKDGNDHHQFVA